MQIPGLGKVTKEDPDSGSYYSERIVVPVLGGTKCRFVIENYDEDPRKDEIHFAIANFLQAEPSVLKDVEKDVYRYYEMCNSNWDVDDVEFLMIDSPADVWRHVRLGDEPIVSRRGSGDKGVYVSLECNCDWEPEHGLQIVFKNGSRVNKIGPYDGHLTNSDAFNNKKLEDVVLVE